MPLFLDRYSHIHIERVDRTQNGAGLPPLVPVEDIYCKNTRRITKKVYEAALAKHHARHQGDGPLNQFAFEMLQTTNGRQINFFSATTGFFHPSSEFLYKLSRIFSRRS